jgi:predicted SAM-dependent methyltransferase
VGSSRNLARPSAERRPPARLNWGCGSHVAGGWVNSDVKDEAGVDLVADIRKGLPLAGESFDYAVSIHALPEFAYPELQPVLEELRRVLKPGGVLRLALPDLDRGIDAYLRGDDAHFHVDPHEVESRGGRFIVHMLWYGYSRTLFTVDFATELLARAGFTDIRACPFGVTCSEFEEIVSLDNRPDESFFIEARRGRGPDLERGRERPDLEHRQYNRRTKGEPSMHNPDITHSTPSDQLRGHFRVEQDGEKLALVGWALGCESPVVGVEVIDNGNVLASAAPVIERPDIARAFPDAAGADTCGFQIDVEPSGAARLELRAQLEDGTHAPLGELAVQTSRAQRRTSRSQRSSSRERKGLLRRFG